jgi:cobalt transporter subunit CbtA
MFRTIVFSAFGAGIAVCLSVSALQSFTTEPLILHAEEFEGQAPVAHDHAAAMSTPAPDANAPVQAMEKHEHEAEPWAPAGGLERIAFTVLANLVVGVAVSLMLLGFMVLKGDPIDARRGLLWGIGGFIAASLLPSLGLPPELPGTPAAEILSRQAWWIATAIASAGGIGLLVFGRQWWLMGAGLILIIAPHIIGAPVPPSDDVSYPGALAGEFVIASMAVSLTLWGMAGLASGWIHQRLSANA